MTKVTRSRLFWLLTFTLLLILGLFVYSKLKAPNSDSFMAPGRNWNSPKKVENYFVESLHMSPTEASEIRNRPGTDGTVNLRLNTNVTLDALVSNLYYYGFIRSENSFRYALMHTKDTTTGQTFIKVDNTRTIEELKIWRSAAITD